MSDKTIIKPENIRRGVLFRNLRDTIAREIHEKSLAPGTPILSTVQMSEKYDVSFVTANRAINELVAEGILYRKRGSGTFVAESAAAVPDSPVTTTLTLYINGLDYAKEKITSPHSWFVWEGLQKGLINAYPGSVRIESETEIVQRARAGEQFAAALVNPALPDIEALEKAGIPTIAVDYNDHLCRKYNSVRKELIYGSYAMMAYLMGTLEHRRIAYIGGCLNEYNAGRYAMYETAHRAFGLPFDEKRVVRGLGGNEVDGYAAARKLLALPELPTAIFGDTDVLALGAIRAIREAGLKVPEDISVAGFDDNPILVNFSPALTTVSMPQDVIGKTAVEMLLERIRTGADQETKIINSSLVIRESCIHAEKA